ncbi:hypothetical protein FKW77_009218 [Venturia effusa]|uniref:GED domain-containing protein n=1 Tax=Venturia effusa TaxID=50376 RepID=A0A517LBM8_9PEZI|nr:hypothetical protein FKW77_009218 [Venturia effusa]
MGDRTIQHGDGEADLAILQLMSADRSALLDVISQVSHIGVTQYVDIPTILVCGDQGSGKSSVLEAIFKLPFPKGDKVCTTFATELTIRRAQNASVSVWIQPAESRTSDEKLKIASFRSSSDSLDHFGTMVTDAKAFLIKQINAGRASYFEDVLHVDVTNAFWSPLTVVDLPGLIHYQNTSQTSEDTLVVERLVRRYLENTKSIIMAVVSADSDLADQRILTMVREMDPSGHRALAVITKPDTLTRGLGDENMFLTYVTNKSPDFTFRYGWHVIKNCGYDTRNCTLVERDAAEESFFANSIWENVLGPEHLGANTLRKRLSHLLEDLTRALLPAIIPNIKELASTCEMELKKLGDSRETPELQRRYLGEISERFQKTVEQALEGNYLDDFFYSKTEQPLRYLRATIRNLNDEFAFAMVTKGHSRGFARARHGLHVPKSPPPSSLNSARYAAIREPEYGLLCSDIDEINSEIESLMRQKRGKELRTLINHNIIREIFRHQSHKWEEIASIHLEEIWRATQRFLFTVARHVANEETARLIRREVIDREMDSRRDIMGEKLKEILMPYKKLHPITHSYTFANCFRECPRSECDGKPRKQDNDSRAALNAWEDANAFYDIALGTFVDNTAVLVVEMCLIEGLESIFSPSQVALMNPDLIQKLASENAITQTKRKRLKTKHEMLRTALTTCLRHLEDTENVIQVTSKSSTTSTSKVASSILSGTCIRGKFSRRAKKVATIPTDDCDCPFDDVVDDDVDGDSGVGDLLKSSVATPVPYPTMKLQALTLSALGLFAIPIQAGWDCFLRNTSAFPQEYYPSAGVYAHKNCALAPGTFANGVCHSNSTGNCPAFFLKAYNALLSAPNKPNITVKFIYVCRHVAA